MGIRVKILLGFLILVCMLFISGAFSIFELTKQGKAVKMMITDSYRSIDYSKRMLDVIEKQERQLILYLGRKDENARDQFLGINQLFEAYIDSARMNLTFVNEADIVDSISFYHNKYKERAFKVFNANTYPFNNYIDSVYSIKVTATEYIKKLMLLNQTELYESAAFHEASSQRAIVPGLIVILTSILFTFIFTYLVNHYFVSPIIKLTKGINDYVKSSKPFDVPLETRDELHSLKESIKDLISFNRLSKKVEP